MEEPPVTAVRSPFLAPFPCRPLGLWPGGVCGRGASSGRWSKARLCPGRPRAYHRVPSGGASRRLEVPHGEVRPLCAFGPCGPLAARSSPRKPRGGGRVGGASVSFGLPRPAVSGAGAASFAGVRWLCGWAAPLFALGLPALGRSARRSVRRSGCAVVGGRARPLAPPLLAWSPGRPPSVLPVARRPAVGPPPGLGLPCRWLGGARSSVARPGLGAGGAWCVPGSAAVLLCFSAGPGSPGGVLSLFLPLCPVMLFPVLIEPSFTLGGARLVYGAPLFPSPAACFLAPSPVRGPARSRFGVVLSAPRCPFQAYRGSQANAA